MSVSSLGFRTDLMLLALGGSSIRERDGLVIASTPDTPDFWWGNFVLAPHVDALDAAIEAHAAAFPDADFVSIGIDGTDGAPGVEATAAARGLTVERSTALSSTAVRTPLHPNTAAEVRRLRTDEDFEAAVDVQFANYPESGRAHTVSRFETWRRLAEDGYGGWYGAFVDGRMCAGLGLFTDGTGVARYQAVDTLEEHRGRGLAGTLLHHAAVDVARRGDVETFVIVADPDDVAIRLYRSVGFDGTQTQVQLLRKPQGDT